LSIERSAVFTDSLLTVLGQGEFCFPLDHD
jgi:hypothetical protein